MCDAKNKLYALLRTDCTENRKIMLTAISATMPQMLLGFRMNFLNVPLIDHW